MQGSSLLLGKMCSTTVCSHQSLSGMSILGKERTSHYANFLNSFFFILAYACKYIKEESKKETEKNSHHMNFNESFDSAHLVILSHSTT